MTSLLFRIHDEYSEGTGHILVPHVYSQVMVYFILRVIIFLFLSLHCWEGPVREHFYLVMIEVDYISTYWKRESHCKIHKD
jgi:hypothetical protein